MEHNVKKLKVDNVHFHTHQMVAVATVKEWETLVTVKEWETLATVKEWEILAAIQIKVNIKKDQLNVQKYITIRFAHVQGVSLSM